MDQPDNVKKRRHARRGIVVAVGIAIAVAVACFTVVAMLPASDKPVFDSPLRSAITGLGLLGVACPLCIAGSLLRRHAAGSPYYEEGFMASVLSLFGYIAMIVGILCLGLAVYALIHHLVAPKPSHPSLFTAWLQCGPKANPVAPNHHPEGRDVTARWTADQASNERNTASEGTRTPNHRFRRPMLYPIELRTQSYALCCTAGRGWTAMLAAGRGSSAQPYLSTL
jgi:hypothetical protein